MTKKTIILIFLLSVFFIDLIYSQSIEIIVRQSDKTPIEGAAVQLKSIEDSSKYVYSTDNKGLAQFNNLKEGLYLLNINFIGFQPVEKTIKIKNSNQRFEYILAEETVTLKEATVIANKPIIRQEDDKMIIDPEPLANISTNTLEILESTPGLFVDPDGGIFMSNSSPATILINGREQKMGSQDIQNILRSLPPGSVKQIEVIRSPSSKYSASSSGGIINIILKKGVKIGQFGSVNLGMNQGVYGNRFVGVNINNMGLNHSSYLNLNYSNNDMVEEMNSEQLKKSQTTINQQSNTRRKANQAYCGYGFGYDASEKLNFTYDGRINGSRPTTLSNNINFVDSVNGQNILNTLNQLNNENQFLNIQQDFGMLYKIDSLGSEWDTKFSYSYTKNTIEQNYNINQIFPDNSETSGDGTNNQDRQYFQFRSDFNYVFPRRINFETGVNINWQNFKSNSDFNINFNGIQIKDPTRTLEYKYKENINSAFLQVSIPLYTKITLKTGLRMEHTYMEGNQTIPTDTSFIVNRVDWFPYVYLSRSIMKIAGFELKGFLIYRRTISRPDYNSLNPYLNYVDELLYEKGNPALNPQFSNNIEANISVDDMPLLAFGRNYTNDIFSSVIYQDPVRENVNIRTYDNLGKSTETYFRAMGAIPPGGKYFFVIGTQYNFNQYDGFYDGEPFKFERGSWRFFTFHSFQLAKETRITLNGFLMTKGLMNFYELDNFGQVNLGFVQNFFDKKLTIMLSARDIFHTMVTNFTLNQGGIYSTGDRYSDNRRFGFNIRYNFGVKNKKEKQNLMEMDIEQ